MNNNDKKKQTDYRNFLKGIDAIDHDLKSFIFERLGRDGNRFAKLRGRLRYENYDAYRSILDAAEIGLTGKSPVVMKDGDICVPCGKKKVRKIRKDLWGLCEDVASFYSCRTGFMDKEKHVGYVVTFKGEDAPGDVDKQIVATSEELLHEFDGKRSWTFGHNNRVTSCKLQPFQARKLKHHKDVVSVEEQTIATIQTGEYAPSPEFVPFAENVDWGVSKINVSYAWDKGIKGKGVKLAICDTGCDYTHIDLIDRYVGGYNFVTDNDNPMDDNGHGSHCAGIACASSNGIGYTGVAPEVDLYAIKVLDAKGSGFFSDIAAGIDWARVHGINIVSLSLAGGFTCTEPMASSILDAWNAGMMIICAAGNEGRTAACDNDDCVMSPAVCPAAVAVAAVNIYENASIWSSRGPQIEVCAPGEGITSVRCVGTNMYGDQEHLVGESWSWANGTSMSCPNVAGACALIKCWFPDATNFQIRGWLRDNAKDL